MVKELGFVQHLEGLNILKKLEYKSLLNFVGVLREVIISIKIFKI